MTVHDAENLRHAARVDDRRLAPLMAEATGELEWYAVTASHSLAVAVSKELDGTVSVQNDGHYRARIPRSVILTVAVKAAPQALWCQLGDETGTRPFMLRCAPWTTEELAACPLTDLPTPGRLSVRVVMLTTRMGRLIRYLAPEFTPT